MKLIQLTAITAAVLASTAALAADPVIVIDGNDAVVYEAEPVAVAYQADAGYAYNADAGVLRNTTGAVVGGTKTFFQTVTHPAAISAEVGTLGYGANIAWGLNDKTEIQAGWAGGDAADLFGGDFDANDVNYDVDTDFSNPYLGVQVRPMANWFTMGAGIIVPDNDIDVTANANNNSYRINNVDYDATQVGTLKGNLEHRNKLAPYATIGFRPNITNNFGLFGELGAAYMGKTDATVNAVNGTNPVLGAVAAADAEKELEDKDWLEWMPIVKVGATYRF
ncbi:hypothetical protein [Psychrobacter cryohalolentis]|uniref:Outer membrane protein G1b n=1 Tax=Psychrobacter cryohalolentis (strain ATCC BAA-1226 / DSM 17306 / VKM B-2378 / K5) TaxID=335284 RepID=Q1QAL3_PSYCK|nr:hypothetical protein [Psychrobacter cryohalolentis]ABE75290.1 conserved hypothetical protein [Psychrobacter cryohalolentis K5]ASE25483.1 hypothetical protein CEP87_02405 [Psychrobacter cryohalolentis]